MRTFPMLLAVILCAVPIGAAHAQQTGIRAPGGPANIPSRMSFAYDAQHGVTATGVQLNATSIKKNVVSPTTGTIDVTINIKIVSGFTTGTTFHCSVNAIGGIIDTDNGTVDGGLETANGFATRTSPGNAACTLRIPYSWTLPRDGGADSGLILAFGVGAINTEDEVQRSTLQVDGIENLPANGTTSNFTFDVAL